MNELVLFAIVLAFPVLLISYNVISKEVKRSHIEKYIVLYCHVILRSLAEDKVKNEEARKFFTYWGNWIGYAAIAESKKESKSAGKPQFLAWKCLYNATDDLGRTLQVHSTYLNNMHEYDKSPWRVREIADHIEYLQNMTYAGKCDLNSYKATLKRYKIPEYELK